jgi:hypothetical protein
MSTSLKLSLVEGGPTKRESIFEDNARGFREKFNRCSFAYTHALAGHPLFDLPRLVELAEVLSESGAVTFFGSDVAVDQGWQNLPQRPLSVAEAIARIEESGSWVLLKSVQHDPEYRALLEQCMAELEGLTGVPLREEITWLEAYIFIASPHSVTPYHMDHESNFLLQIHGEKEINIFDPRDRSILTEQEIEGYYMGNLSAATYHKENQKKASVYRLTPGTGVHLPVRAPHWVKNGDSFSVSLSFNFCMRAYDRQARIYQVNNYLRRTGITPLPPGVSALRDAAKSLAVAPLWAYGEFESKYDLLRRGVRRFEAPMRLGRRIAHRLRPASS